VPVFVQELDFDVLTAEDALRYRERFNIQHRYILDIYNIFETTGSEFYPIVRGVENFDPNERVLLMVFEYFATDLGRQLYTMAN